MHVFPHKPHHFGIKYHNIVCELSKVIYHVDIIDYKDRPQGMVQKEFNEKGEMKGLTVRMIKPVRGTGKVVIMDSGFCILEGLVLMVENDVLGSAFVNKWRYWPKGVPVEDILWHIQKK